MSMLGILRFLFDLAMSPPSLKGWVGERRVEKTVTCRLDPRVYRQMRDVTLQTDDGSTQIDHLVFSPFGIFVIETKNRTGWIFGSQYEAQWTSKHYRHTERFQNPLRQNHRHIKVLSELFDIPDHWLKSVEAFVGDADLKTEMPPNVLKGSQFIEYIKTFNQAIIPEDEIERLMEVIARQRMPPGLRTHVQHTRNLRRAHTGMGTRSVAPPVASTELPPRDEAPPRSEAPPRDEAPPSNEAPICPRCGAPMLERTARRGANSGQRFFGCSRYPKCRAILEHRSS